MTLLNSKEAAKLLGLTPGALNVRRCRGTLPIPYIRISERSVRYKLEDIEAYLTEHHINPTTYKES